MMELSATRYVKIEGTEVTATVNSAAEAKHAIKEVRQKKREVAHVKRGLLRDKRAAERRANQVKRSRKEKPNLLGKVRNAISAVAAVTGAYGTASAIMDLPQLERKCVEADEILHNLDTVLIQLQGKLLQLS